MNRGGPRSALNGNADRPTSRGGAGRDQSSCSSLPRSRPPPFTPLFRGRSRAAATGSPPLPHREGIPAHRKGLRALSRARPWRAPRTTVPRALVSGWTGVRSVSPPKQRYRAPRVFFAIPLISRPKTPFARYLPSLGVGPWARSLGDRSHISHLSHLTLMVGTARASAQRWR